jgi:serine/threonine protein kinase
MWTDDGPVIVDFGAACGKALLAGETAETIVGTFGYMPPEMLKGKASPASDLYSLGATLLFAFSGREPETFPEVRNRIQFRESLALPDRLADLLEAMLEPAVEDRVATAKDAMDILDGKARPATAAAKPDLVKLDEKPVTREKARFRGLKVTGAITTAAIIVALITMGPAALLVALQDVAIGAAVIVIVILVILAFIGGF